MTRDPVAWVARHLPTWSFRVFRVVGWVAKVQPWRRPR